MAGTSPATGLAAPGRGGSLALLRSGAGVASLAAVVYTLMARKLRRATLIHNEKAGDRRHGRAYLVGLLEGAGYDVSYFAVKQSDLAEALGHPAEIIVSAGGDGTVARVVAEARSDGPPIAILPLGTANNIATSLGIGGPIED